MKRHALLIVAACVLAACDTPPRAPAEPATPGPTEPQPSPAPSPSPTPPPPSGPATPVAQQQAQKAALAAAEMLESGNEEPARAELKRALGMDPQNKLALNLTRQMAADPLATLGRESFVYTVRPSDTMSRIAQRFLGDVYAFYILSRYNDIKVPKQVSSGQVIRIPGKAPPPSQTSPAATPEPAPPRATAPPPPAPQPSAPPPPPPFSA